MFDYPYIVEILSPKRSPESDTKNLLARFAERFEKVMEAGWGVSIPDNPMGQPRLGALETIELAGLSLDPEKTVMNLNTFHEKDELDALLRKADDARLQYILVVRGDGGPLLPRLDPVSIGGRFSVATSIDLLRYINTAYPGRFITGAAFNPYKPADFELDRARQKIDAGARYFITQPILGPDKHVDALQELQTTVVVEAWMSQNIELLYKSVGKADSTEEKGFNPAESLRSLHSHYPDCCVYLSMLSFKQQWKTLLPRM
jgi:methylenetetrahydrofolate reductase (NADPH)